MKRPSSFIVILTVLVLSFAAGYWYRAEEPAKNNPPGRQQLQPSPAAALSPDTASEGDDVSSVPGAVQASPEKQRIMGVRVEAVKKAPESHVLRVLGRVAADETRTYRINAAVDGWIRAIHNDTTGSLVKKNEVLSTFYSPEFLAATQAYIYALGSMDRFRGNSRETSQQLSVTELNLFQYKDSLHNLGMSDIQIAEIGRTRQYTEDIQIRSPATGFVTFRNVSEGLRFEKGTELYRIVDLGRVWIMADIYENEARYLQPGKSVKVLSPQRGKALTAKVGAVLPLFDAATRTLKIRLEMENPGYLLRPDMFVDVELPVSLPPAIVVPAAAVLDLGMRKTIFVARGEGFFEPRQVETGWRFGDRVEIINGLRLGEWIVASGNFLIDSESRMELAASGKYGTLARDPVCGSDVAVKKAEKAGRASLYKGKAYYFSSLECKQQFDRNPDRYLEKPVKGMINRIIDFSVKNKFIVFALVAMACLAGWRSMNTVALDAIPDLSDTQVIIYSRWDRSPDIIEDQVTYPIVTAMLGAPRIKAVRGFSDFGYSYVYVLFEDDADIYWARSRIQEYLSTVLPKLPEGVNTELGPDATALGWVFQYALIDESGTHSLADLRSYQDWYLRYYLKAVPGVAEVAPIGGFRRQYQVNVDPNRLQAYGISINRVVDAVRGGNKEVGGRLIEFGSTEYMVQGRGYARSIADFEEIVLTASENGTPIRVKDIGQVVQGPEQRRGVTDLDGKGEVVSGIVIMRHGQNALDVIDRVKAKIEEIKPGLPAGMKIVPIYDRSDLIRRAIDNLKSTIAEVIITVSLVILLFLGHIPSAIIPVITIPVAVLMSFIPFRMLGVSANIMSLAGIAIAIGALVDASIVVVEQAHKGLEEWERTGRREDEASVVVRAVKQVAGPSFFALLVIAVSFLPVLTLEAQEGRLFKPLAYTKTLAMIMAAILTITMDPALRLFLTHRKALQFRPRWLSRGWNAVFASPVPSEEKHPISRRLIRIYRPVLAWSLRRKAVIIIGALALMIATVPVYLKLGSEYMPPLDEGSILYMPTTMPGISITEAKRLLQATDQIIKQFPEVDRVLGKAGRAETATDPAPLSMMETVITLKPRSEWRRRDTWYSSWTPDWAKAVFRRVTPDHISQEELIRRMNEALLIPGLANAWTMPIKGRIEMLSTGIRTPVGLKISGADLDTIEEIGAQVETVLSSVAGTRSVFAERTGSGYFLDFKWNRAALARYGLSIDEVQEVISRAIGGENVTTTVEGRERYSVNVRYMRDFREDIPALGRVLVPASGGQRQIPLSQLAGISTSERPSMIRDEDGMLTGYVYVDMAGRDQNGYIAEAGRLIREKVKLPPGYAIFWSGEYESTERMKNQLRTVIPLTVLLIILLLYTNTRSFMKTFTILLSVPFSAVGAFWILYLLGYNMSIGVWVGLIALLGVDAETGVFMLLYLDLAYEKAKSEGRLRSLADLQEAIRYGAVMRLRPKFMTVATMFLGLIPIMWSLGAGSDVMKRIAAPMIGGIFTSFLLELLVYPVIYQIWKWRFVLKKELDAAGDRSHYVAEKAL